MSKLSNKTYPKIEVFGETWTMTIDSIKMNISRNRKHIVTGYSIIGTTLENTEISAYLRVTSRKEKT